MDPQYLNYLDPAIVLIMSVLMIPTPYQIIKDNVLELLLSSPSIDIQKVVVDIVDKELKDMQVIDYYLKGAKPGRMLFINLFIHAFEDKDLDIDALRLRLNNAFKKAELNVDLCIEDTKKAAIFEDMKS